MAIIKTLKIYIVLILIGVTSSMYAQDCKVLLKTINKSYKGTCKKGKADGHGTAKGIDSYTGNFKKGYPDGKGVYTFGNGDVYEGEFNKGKKHGEGVFTKATGTVQKGFWKKDDYIGMYETAYKKLDKSPNVSSYTIVSAKSGTQSIRFYIKENQNNVRNPGANIVLHHGNYSNEVKTRDYIELLGVTYPFKAKVYINQEYIEFELFNAGSWNITTNITSINGLNNN